MPDLGPLFPASSLPWMLGAAVLVSVGAILIVAGLTALFSLRPLRFTTRTLLGLLLIALGLLEGTITLGIQGYRALTREDLAARIAVRPSGPQRFSATLVFPDGRQASYLIAGDEIYVDARILKWHALANALGLHTAYELDRVGGRYREIDKERANSRTLYELDRVGGRYREIDKERANSRTLYELGQAKPVDLFELRKRFPFLAALFDAEYGSAAFFPVSEPADLELRISTTGLLIRPAPAAK